MKWSKTAACAVLLLAALAAGCNGGSDSAPPAIIIAPTTATALPLGTVQFAIAVSGLSDNSVNWFVNDVQGGNSTVGTISTNGLYTAPASVPNPPTVTVRVTSATNSNVSATATVTIDSGIAVTISPSIAFVGTGEQFQFFATVTGTTNQTVNWFVNDVQGGNSTVGTITTNGLYTAPAAVPNPPTVTIRAASQADTTRVGTVATVISAATPPTLTAITPSTIPQGALFQDIYLAGTAFLSTSTVRVNGNGVPSLVLSSTAMRVRLSTALLSAPGNLSIDVQPQNGPATAAINIAVVPVRPALAGSSPDSVPQGSNTVGVDFNGGYFSPSVTTEFNGQLRASTPVNSRRVSVTLGAGDLTTAGLFSIAVRNSGAAPPLAAANMAVQPTAAPSVAATLGVGTMPSAVAVNTATGIAVVANRGSNDVHLVDLNTNTVSGPFAVGTSPTGVAVDSVRNLALVVNNGSGSVTVLNATTGATVATISGFGSFKPVSVGVNPNNGLGVVALETTNVAAVIDLATNTIVSASSATTGTSPRVAIEPRLNWAVVSPGGSGALTIIDLNRRTTVAIDAAGAVRNANSVTVTTSANHGLIPGQAVLISGVGDNSFNGIFSVATVTSNTTFTYSQTGPNASSGGGSVSSTPNLATVTLGVSVRGVAVNTEAQRIFLADPASSALVVMSTLDQTVRSAVVEPGHVAAAVNSLTDIGVSTNINTDEASVIDLRTPQRLHRIGVGMDPVAVAIDPGSNTAIVANEGSGNVTVLNLGAIRTLHVAQVSPVTALTSANPLTLTIDGFGFVNGMQVRLDEQALATTFVGARQLTATVPAALLAGPRRFALDVFDPNTSARSNVSDFAVYQIVAVGDAPRGVAIDSTRNLALVANSGSNNVSVIDLTTGTVTDTITAGTNPEAVAVLEREGRAFVTNRTSNNVTAIDLLASPRAVLYTLNVGAEPLGIAINQDTGNVVVANASSANLTIFTGLLTAAPTTSSFAVQLRPTALEWDIVRNQLAVTHATTNSLQILQFGGTDPVLVSNIGGFQVPSGVVYDPVSDRYIVASSLTNNLVLVDPTNSQATLLRVGINPTALAYNVNSATLVTVNSASRTLSVLDFIDRRVRAILPLEASQRFSIAIHPASNMAVISDEANDRVYLVPLPR